MFRVLVVCAVTAGAAACNTTGQTGPSPRPQRQAQERAAVAQCDAKAKSKQITSLAAYSRCVGAAEAIGVADMGANADLLFLKSAKRTAIYERVDRGEISLAQADAEIAQVNSGLVSELNRRYTADRAASPPPPVTCTRFGNSVTCF